MENNTNNAQNESDLKEFNQRYDEIKKTKEKIHQLLKGKDCSFIDHSYCNRIRGEIYKETEKHNKLIKEYGYEKLIDMGKSKLVMDNIDLFKGEDMSELALKLINVKKQKRLTDNLYHFKTKETAIKLIEAGYGEYVAKEFVGDLKSGERQEVINKLISAGHLNLLISVILDIAQERESVGYTGPNTNDSHMDMLDRYADSGF